MNTPEHVLNFWFGKNDDYHEFWFDRSKDEYITQTYSSLLKELEEGGHTFREWTVTDEKTLATIIVLDQFSRSVYRGTDDVYKNDETAYALSQKLLKNGYDLSLPLSRRVFILLPFRHQKESDLLDVVMKKIREYENELGPSPLLSRFRNATIMSYTGLTDRIERSYCELEFCMEDYRDVIDDECFNKKNEYVEDYMQSLYKIAKYPIYKTLLSFIREKKIKNIGVSLSGGVDSMVICFLLRILQINGLLENVYAMHLEYCNREESRRETEMISMYCGMIKVPLFIRVIDYMSRDSVDRSFYEEETRKVRFATYRHLSQRYDISGWCLGHHHGDISENVLMNLYNGRDLLDLTVMSEESVIDAVHLYRPLLTHSKKEIYELAEVYQIPYTKDTTPDWSCRGLIRRKLLPLMKDQWPMIEKNLSEIGKQSEEWASVVNTFVMEPLKKSVVMNKERTIVEMELKQEYDKLPKVVWMNLFIHIFHNMGIHMISRKNLVYFMEIYTRNREKQHQFMFSNGCVGFFMTNRLKIVKLNEKNK